MDLGGSGTQVELAFRNKHAMIGIVAYCGTPEHPAIVHNIPSARDTDMVYLLLYEVGVGVPGPSVNVLPSKPGSHDL